MNNEQQVAIPAHTRKKNGFALASFILGILPTVILGLLFGVLGVFRARRVHRGMTMSLVGIVLSLAWIAPIAIVTPHLMKSMDPGCRAAKKIEYAYPQSRLAVDFNDPARFKADNAAIVNGLMDASARSKLSDASAYMVDVANDTQAVETMVELNKIMGAGIVEKTDNDEAALHKACGDF